MPVGVCVVTDSDCNQLQIDTPGITGDNPAASLGPAVSSPRPQSHALSWLCTLKALAAYHRKKEHILCTQLNFARAWASAAPSCSWRSLRLPQPRRFA